MHTVLGMVALVINAGKWIRTFFSFLRISSGIGCKERWNDFGYLEQASAQDELAWNCRAVMSLFGAIETFGSETQKILTKVRSERLIEGQYQLRAS